MDTKTENIADIVQRPAKGNWIGRHWRGELSLGISYWLNGLLSSLAAISLGGALAALTASASLQTAFFVLAILWGIGILAQVWLTVGIWRSAVKHPSRGGKRFWSVAARVMCVAITLQLVSALYNAAWPQFSAAYDAMNNNDEQQAHYFRLLNNGTELEFSGWITFGLADELEKRLAATPSIRVIHLHSDGGRLNEAEKVRDLIRTRHLTTYVSSKCSSACTIVFLGGSERILRPDGGKLGFHQPSFPGVGQLTIFWVSQKIIDDAVRAGVTRDFMEKAYATDSSTLWHPSTEEAIASGYATGVSHGQFALSGFEEHITKEGMAAQLRRLPFYDIIEKAEPDLFDKIADIFTNAALQGIPAAEVYSAVKVPFLRLLPKYLPHASDEAVLTMAQVRIDKIEAILAVDPIACHAFLFPEQGKTVDINIYANDDLQTRIYKASKDALLSGMSNPIPAVSAAEAAPLLKELYDRIAQRYGPETVQHMQTMKDGNNKAQTCTLARMIYSEALLMPQSQAIPLLRYTYSLMKL